MNVNKVNNCIRDVFRILLNVCSEDLKLKLVFTPQT